MMEHNQQDTITLLVQQLNMQQVIAYPTEAVFGLGCDPDSQTAVERLLILKQRSWKKGLILIAANYEQLLPYIDDFCLNRKQKRAVLSSNPMPITWVMPKRKSTPIWLTGEFASLAIRISNHRLVQELCLAFGKPIVSTSANLVGFAPCRSEQEVKKQFGDHFPVLKGTIDGYERPSEIRDALTGQILRKG